MRVRILGTAAGGGLPQWNCACPVCDAARATAQFRTQDCLAISGDATTWYLVNAAPDIRGQILATPELSPGPGPRQTPLRGALLTSGELDHTLGLAALREANDFTVYATATVLDALPIRVVIDPYGAFRWTPVERTCVALDGGLTAELIPVGRKKPRYAASAPDAADWVVACRFTDTRTGGVLVYAPGLAAWTPELAGALDGAACVLLDGSFFTDNDMVDQTGAGRTAREMGHLPIQDSLVHRSAHQDTRWLYTHLNNTNPVLVEGSPQQRTLRAAGAEVATDGMVLDL